MFLRLAATALSLSLVALSASAQPADTLQKEFEAAIADAKVAEGSEVNTNLFNIAPWNDKLIWQNPEAKDKVMVVSWMSANKFKAVFGDDPDKVAAGTVGETVPGWYIWVTAAPQMQEACRTWNLAGEALELRMKQYLGLNSTWSYYGLVSAYVDPKDLYRPCPDPQINDKTCQLATAEQGLYAEEPAPAYQKWFTDLKAKSYDPKSGAPWTRLGYTYDWGVQDGHVGGSEYLIADAGKLVFANIQQPEGYCAPAK